MAAESGNSRSVIRPEEGARRLAGELLQRRRSDLGYGGRRRRAFARDRGINPRLLSDIENPQQGRNYLISSVADIARAYAVTYESVTAVLRGEAGGLVPVQDTAPAALDVPLAMTDPARMARAAPLAVRIWERVWALAVQGTPDPSGAQVFGGGSADATAWDAVAGRWPVPDRVWMVADLQARDDGPPGRLGQDAAG